MAERITFEIYSEKYPGIRRRDIAERLSITAVAHTTLPIIKQVNVQVPASLNVASTGVGLQQTNVQLTISLNTLSTGIGPPQVSVKLPVPVCTVSTGSTMTLATTVQKITQGFFQLEYVTAMRSMASYVYPIIFPFVPPDLVYVVKCPGGVLGVDFIDTSMMFMEGSPLICQSGGVRVYMSRVSITTGLNLQTSTSATT